MHDYSGQSTPSFSYTLYDNLSRIVEVGRQENSTPLTYNISRSLAGSSLSTWLSGASLHSELIKTYYDTPYSSAVSAYFGTGGQQEVRGRVASTAFWANQTEFINWEQSKNITNTCQYDVHPR